MTRDQIIALIPHIITGVLAVYGFPLLVWFCAHVVGGIPQ